MIELGGNIKLDGHFQELDPPTLIIVKKIVGNYAKKIGEAGDFSELLLDLKKESDFQLKATLKTQNNNLNSEASEPNIFFALNKALEEIHSKAQK